MTQTVFTRFLTDLTPPQNSNRWATHFPDGENPGNLTGKRNDLTTDCVSVVDLVPLAPRFVGKS
jgi:hypothetical protein